MFKEWVIISLVLGCFSYLVVTSSTSSSRLVNPSPSNLVMSEIRIKILGAVKRPGEYSCAPGTKLQEVLKRAGILGSANSKKIPLKKILLVDQTIEIPKKKGREKISLVEKQDFCYDLSS
jgi:hypothetical protein